MRADTSCNLPFTTVGEARTADAADPAEKMVLFAKMQSNSMKNASNRADLPFSPPQTIREPKCELIIRHIASAQAPLAP
jgi:hypothetical protein